MKIAKMRVVKSSFQSQFNLRGSDSFAPLNDAGFEEGETVVVLSREEFMRLATAPSVDALCAVLASWGEGIDMVSK